MKRARSARSPDAELIRLTYMLRKVIKLPRDGHVTTSHPLLQKLGSRLSCYPSCHTVVVNPSFTSSTSSCSQWLPKPIITDQHLSR